jgi:hypothetical protein
MYDIPMSRLPRRWRSGGGSSAHGRKKSARPAVGSASQGPGNVPQAHLELGARKNSASEAPTARPISRRKSFSGQQTASPSAAFRWPPRRTGICFWICGRQISKHGTHCHAADLPCPHEPTKVFRCDFLLVRQPQQLHAGFQSCRLEAVTEDGPDECGDARSGGFRSRRAGARV